VDETAALEALGIAEGLPDAEGTLRAAATRWTQLGRPLDAARCMLLLGHRLRSDPPQARTVLQAAAESFDMLGVGHLAARCRRLMPV
jgi:hypothetical protein